jgi:hypothetical protein
MLELTAQEIQSFCLTPGGDVFAQFVASLIRNELLSYGITLDNLEFTARTDIPDGGVDALVKQAVPQTAWLSEPTIWQFKASQEKPDLIKEINKPRVVQFLKQGYQYRLCIAKPIADKSDWEDILNAEITKLSTVNASAKVVSIDDLATWTVKFPAIALNYRNLLGDCQAFEAWGASAGISAIEYVANPENQATHQALLEHLNFSKTPDSILMSIFGKPGVGKTRFVYETLKEIKADGLVVIANDEQNAIKLLTLASNCSDTRMILVADDCSLEEKIQSHSKALKDRIRVIAIRNTVDRINRVEYELNPIPESIIEQIIQHSFPLISMERRQHYIRLSKGFLRLAIAMCQADAQIAEKQSINAVYGSIEDFYRKCIRGIQKDAIELLSLVTKVGYKSEFADELKHLCSFAGKDYEAIRKAARELKNIGFVILAGRFLYVTPEIIAHVALQGAYSDYFEDRVEEQLPLFPEELFKSFIQRIEQVDDAKIRTAILPYLSKLCNDFQIQDFADSDKANSFFTCLKLDLATYLPYLERLMENTSFEEINALGLYENSGYSSYNQIINVIDEIRAFPQYFGTAEQILFRCAMAENEATGASATKIWVSCFRILYSSSPLPFEDRLNILKKHLFSDDEYESKLAFSVINQIIKVFDETYWMWPKHSLSKIPPNQWNPTYAEIRACYRLILDVVKEYAQKHIGTPEVREFLRDGFSIFVLDKVNLFKEESFIDDIEELLQNFDEDTSLKQELFAKIADEELFFKTVLSEKVVQLKQKLINSKTHAKVLQLVGMYHAYPHQDVPAQAKDLAKSLLQNLDVLKQEIPFLFSTQSINIEGLYQLGLALGREGDAKLTVIILDYSRKGENTIMARGYVTGYVEQHKKIDGLQKQLKDMELMFPNLACILYLAGGQKLNDLENTFRMLKEERLNDMSIAEMMRQIFQKWNPENIEFLNQFLDYITNKLSVDPNKDLLFAYSQMAYFLLEKRDSNSFNLLENLDILQRFLRLIDLYGTMQGGYVYGLIHLAKRLFPYAPEKIATLLFSWIGEHNYSMEADTVGVVCSFAKKYETVLLDGLKKSIESNPFAYYALLHFKPLMSAFSVQGITNLFDSLTPEAQRVLIKYFPLPYLNKEKEPVVPESTLYILKRYGDDEKLFNVFCVEAHNFRNESSTVSLYRQDAEVAQAFLDYPEPIIQKWARQEKARAEANVKWMQQVTEEQWLP